MTTSQAVEPETKPKSFLRTGLPFFVLAHAAHHFLMALQQPLFPTIRTYFKVETYTEASFIPMSFALASAIGQLPGGILADKIGPVALIMVGTLGVALAGVAVGLSQSYVMFLVFLMLMGLLSGGYHPSATPLISASVDPKIRGRALGIHLVGGNSAFFVTPIIAGGIVAAFGPDLGWRLSFLILAVPTIVFAVIFWWYLTKRGGNAHVQAIKRSIPEMKAPQPGYKRRLIAFLTIMVIGGGVTMSVTPFLTLYMTDNLGVPEAIAGGLMSIVFSSGLWAGPVGGLIGDKIGSVKVIIATGLVGGVLLFSYKYVSYGWSLYLLLWLQGLFQSMRMPVTEAFIMSQAPGKHRSKIFGLYYSTMQWTGAIFALPGGVLLDHFGFNTMFTWAGIGVFLTAIVNAFFIWDAKDHYNAEMEAEKAAIAQAHKDAGTKK
jgi:MFS family permease